MARDRELGRSLDRIRGDIATKQDERARLAQEEERLRMLIDDAKTAEQKLRVLDRDLKDLERKRQEKEQLRMLIAEAKTAEGKIRKTTQELRGLDKDLEDFEKTLQDLIQQVEAARKAA